MCPHDNDNMYNTKSSSPHERIDPIRAIFALYSLIMLLDIVHLMPHLEIYFSGHN